MVELVDGEFQLDGSVVCLEDHFANVQGIPGLPGGQSIRSVSPNSKVKHLPVVSRLGSERVVFQHFRCHGADGRALVRDRGSLKAPHNDVRLVMSQAQQGAFADHR